MPKPRIENDTEIRDPRESEKKQRRRKPTEDSHRKFDVDKFFGNALIDKAREPRADAHGKQINAYYQRKLGDGIAENIGRKRSGKQLVDQAAGSDDENIEE